MEQEIRRLDCKLDEHLMKYCKYCRFCCKNLCFIAVFSEFDFRTTCER